jgi:hypothetical protein
MAGGPRAGGRAQEGTAPIREAVLDRSPKDDRPARPITLPVHQIALIKALFGGSTKGTPQRVTAG